MRAVQPVPGHAARAIRRLSVAYGSATQQFGKNSDAYVDWRFRIGFDLTEDNLLYFLVATGNKAPSFNDTVDLDTGPGVSLFTPPVGPEKNTMFEIGSKNTIDVAGNPMVFNASAYYSKYTDQVFSTGIGIQLLDNDPSNDFGCNDTDPSTPCSIVTLNQNIGEATNMGIQSRWWLLVRQWLSTSLRPCCGRTLSTRTARWSRTTVVTIRARARCSSISVATSCHARRR